jgi:hypothetical protein
MLMSEYNWSKEYCMFEVGYAELFYWYDVIMKRKENIKIPKRFDVKTTPQSIHNQLDKFLLDKK